MIEKAYIDLDSGMEPNPSEVHASLVIELSGGSAEDRMLDEYIDGTRDSLQFEIPRLELEKLYTSITEVLYGN